MTVKKLDSGYRMIEILKLLYEKPATYDEICMALEDDGIGVNRETISKYFVSLREFGCVIQKRAGKFHLEYFPFSLNLRDDEAETLSVLKNISASIMSDEENFALESAYKKILSFLNIDELNGVLKGVSVKQSLNENNKETRAKINELSELIKRKDIKLEITYDGKVSEVRPKQVKCYKENVYLYAHDVVENLNRLFLFEKIENMAVLPSLWPKYEFNSATTFKIRGRLEKTYVLQNDETAIRERGFSFITSKLEDKELLYKRLMRYGDLCEVVYTEPEREKFKNMLQDLISHHS